MPDILLEVVDSLIDSVGGWLVLIWIALAAVWGLGIRALARDADPQALRLVQDLFPLRGRWLRRGLLPLFLATIAAPLGALTGGALIAGFAICASALMGLENFSNADLGMRFLIAATLGGLLGALSLPSISLRWMGYGRWAGLAMLASVGAFLGTGTSLSPGTPAGVMLAEGFAVPGIGAPFLWTSLLFIWGVVATCRKPKPRCGLELEQVLVTAPPSIVEPPHTFSQKDCQVTIR